jgi:hypothetical protein
MTWNTRGEVSELGGLIKEFLSIIDPSSGSVSRGADLFSVSDNPVREGDVHSGKYGWVVVDLIGPQGYLGESTRGVAWREWIALMTDGTLYWGDGTPHRGLSGFISTKGTYSLERGPTRPPGMFVEPHLGVIQKTALRRGLDEILAANGLRWS